MPKKHKSHFSLNCVFELIKGKAEAVVFGRKEEEKNKYVALLFIIYSLGCHSAIQMVLNCLYMLKYIFK